MNKKKVGVFITGRLGSERLPKKLILPLGESNLWEMACRKLSSLPDDIPKYALCCDEELIEIAAKYLNINIILREPGTAVVDGPLKYIYKDLESVDNGETHLMFLNPCLSFIKRSTILESIRIFESSLNDYATSVKTITNWLFNEKNESINYIDYETLSTKEIEPLCQAAHVFHIFNKKQFFDDGLMLKKEHGLIRISEEESIDIDTIEDYQYAKFLHSRKYVIDIDGVVCSQEDNTLDYSKAKPIMANIKKLNNLYEAGNTLVYQTARGYETGKDWRGVTEKQFKEWGIKHHKLLMGKPSADYYIDDKAINSNDFFRSRF